MLPAREAFWTWLVWRGFLLNAACTLGALVLVATAPDGATLLLWLAAFLHLIAVPYNTLCLVGIWRSTDTSAVAYRVAAALVFVVFLVL